MLWPGSTQFLADRIGIGRGVDLVIYIAIVTLFYLVFRLHMKVELINRQITKVVREKALSEVDKNKQ